MKKTFLFAAMALIMISCSSNDEDSLPADELLAGTEWRYGSFSDGEILPPPTSITQEDNFNQIFELFPNIEYSTSGTYIIEHQDTISLNWWKNRQRGTLIFNNRTCLFREETYDGANINTYNSTYQDYNFIEQTCISPYITLKITSNSISLYRTDSHVLLNKFELNNYKYQRLIKSEGILTIVKELNIKQEEETFNYQRTGNEVVLTNSNKKWIGTLNTDAWTLSFVQIVPEKKELLTFSLK